MEVNAGNSDTLIHGIFKDAENEAEKIIKEAEAFVKEREAASDYQVKEILKEVEEKIIQARESISKNYEASISIEKKRIALKVKEYTVKVVIDRVKQLLEEMIEKENYKNILINWIIEAAIGLDADEAFVNASQKERKLITRSLLEGAEEKLEKLTGHKVKLSLAEDQPLLGQGIVLFAKNRRTKFNNQTPTRLLRNVSKIRKIIYDEMFSK